MRELRWIHMTKPERLESITANVSPEVRERVEAAFAGKRIPDDPEEAINVVLREAWFVEHGSYERWDRNAEMAALMSPATGILPGLPGGPPWRGEGRDGRR